MIKELKSKISWIIILYMVFMTGTICGCLYLLWFMTFRDEKPPAIGIYVLPFMMEFSFLALLLLFISQSKRITITEDGFSIRYFFRKKMFTYKNEELLGFREYYHSGKNYLYFKTSDGQTFMFNSSEFSNFSRLQMAMMAKSAPMEIDTLFYLPLFLRLLAVAFGVVLGVTLLLRWIASLL